MKKRSFIWLIVSCVCLTFPCSMPAQAQNGYYAPANRDRTQQPRVFQPPQAYVYAYYQLPYAIDLMQVPQIDMGYGTSSNSFLYNVIVKFNSVRLSVYDERRILDNAIAQLQQLLARQNYLENQSMSRYDRSSQSGVTQAFALGAAEMAMREAYCTKSLMNLLQMRRSNL